MADDKKSTEPTAEIETKARKQDMPEQTAPEPTETAESVDAQTGAARQEPTHKHALLLVLGIVLMVFVVVMAFAAGRNSWQHDMSRATVRSFGGDMQLSPNSMQYRTHGSGGAMPGGGEYGTNSGGTQTSNTRVSGVVTAVDGDTITVAGNGTTTKVSVSSNTTYNGSSQPAKVNDSIMAFGAKNSDGVLVASDVRLIRQ